MSELEQRITTELASAEKAKAEFIASIPVMQEQVNATIRGFDERITLLRRLLNNDVGNSAAQEVAKEA